MKIYINIMYDSVLSVDNGLFTLSPKGAADEPIRLTNYQYEILDAIAEHITELEDLKHKIERTDYWTQQHQSALNRLTKDRILIEGEGINKEIALYNALRGRFVIPRHYGIMRTMVEVFTAGLKNPGLRIKKQDKPLSDIILLEGGDVAILARTIMAFESGEIKKRELVRQIHIIEGDICTVEQYDLLVEQMRVADVTKRLMRVIEKLHSLKAVKVCDGVLPL